MKLTIIKDDGVVGVDGVFRQVDLSTMPEGVRVIQWDGEQGEAEYYDSNIANTRIDTIAAVQSFIDLWNAAAPPPPPEPTPAERIAAAHDRINAAYEAAVNALTAGYPQAEIASWPKQEIEARALLANGTPSAWIIGAASERAISVEGLAALIISNANALAPLHGELTGKRQRLRDHIDDAGSNATQEELDAIQW